MKANNPRFDRFKSILKRELGERCELLAGGEVFIYANEFSSNCKFHTLQAAIDSYARFMPQDLIQ